ncbi:hypothetical protein GCM10009582_29210 [Arthrobacter flavus]
MPVAGAVHLDGDILDDRLAAPIAQGHPAVEKLTHHQHFGAALFEAAEVHQSGADDLGRINRRDPGHRDKDPPFTRHLHHQANSLGRGVRAEVKNHRIAESAQTVTQWVKHVEAKQARHENAGGISTHLPRLLWNCRIRLIGSETGEL